MQIFGPLVPNKKPDLNKNIYILKYQKMRNEAQIEKNSCFYYKLVSGDAYMTNFPNLRFSNMEIV